MQSVLLTHLLECYKLECVSLAFFHIICYHINLTKLLLLKVPFFFFFFRFSNSTGDACNACTGIVLHI